MQMQPVFKKQRLSVGTTNRNTGFPVDDFGDWEEDLDVDDNLIQQIETQGYSQHPVNLSERDIICEVQDRNVVRTIHNNNCSAKNDLATLQDDLRTKKGEVKNLRLEIEHREKEYQTQIAEKNHEIAQLRKQLSGKKSEIEFQKLEMKSQLSKNRISISQSPKILHKQPTNLNNSFHERFSKFSVSKKESNEVRVFKFTKQLDKGDVLHKSLRRILLNDEFLSETKNENSKPGDNEFTLNIKLMMLQSCWYKSLEEIKARSVIKLVIVRINEMLKQCYQDLSQANLLGNVNQKSKVITLFRLKDSTGSINSEDLLKHTKLSPIEEGVAVRQAIAALCKLLEIQPNVANMLIERELPLVARCPYTSRNETTNSEVSSMVPIDNIVNGEERMEVDPSSSSLENSCLKKDLVFDVVELLHDIVQQITVKNKLNEYEGVLSSTLYLYSVLCSHDDIIIYEKQQILIVNTLHKILFSLPSFVIIRYILEFLSASTKYSFSEFLCCRSAVETFSENFKCYNFTKETCMLQVLCAYIEMTRKTPDFIDRYMSWLSSCLAPPHNLHWVDNKTNPKLCECLLMLEQITIRIVLNCVEQLHNSKLSAFSKSSLRTSLSYCIPIFQRFRRRDSEFDLHITTCREEYKLLLNIIPEILPDDRTKDFVEREYEFLHETQRYSLSSYDRNHIVKSCLKTFLQDNYS